MRLIDADALIEQQFKNDISYNAFCSLVKRQKTINAQTVRHGHWIYTPTNLLGYVCSECGNGMCRFNYCPHCGALMDEVT